MKAEITVRRGERKDIPELLDIYNYEVVHGVATLDLELVHWWMDYLVWKP